MNDKHTPVPWKFGGLNSWEIFAVAHGETICTIHAAEEWEDGLLDVKHERSIAKANAAFIVHAVNCHDMLVEALKDVMAMITDGLLVRDITKDGDPKWAINVMHLAMRLNKIQLVIAQAIAKANP